jgi:FkbM family methyltransferase
MRLLPARLSRKPQYIFHPGRLLRRAGYKRQAQDGRYEVAELPWGLPLEVHTSDAIGFSILVGRVFDPTVTEALHRLIDPGDRVIDVGANIGYMSSLAAARAGPTGEVHAFEPHPHVFDALRRNAERWRGREGVANVELHNAALSDESGSGELGVGPVFEANMGLSSLRGDEAPAGNGGNTITVSLSRLDQLLADERVGLVKIDVEGHEAGVLRGAEALFADGLVRDIVFEDHDPYPSEPTEIAEAAGFTLISLDNDLFGLRLDRPEDRDAEAAWPGPSYLATRDPERARQRLTPRGWQVAEIAPSLRGRRRAPRR